MAVFRGGGSRRRRGYNVDIPWRSLLVPGAQRRCTIFAVQRQVTRDGVDNGLRAHITQKSLAKIRTRRRAMVMCFGGWTGEDTVNVCFVVSPSVTDVYVVSAAANAATRRRRPALGKERVDAAARIVRGLRPERTRPRKRPRPTRRSAAPAPRGA